MCLGSRKHQHARHVHVLCETQLTPGANTEEAHPNNYVILQSKVLGCLLLYFFVDWNGAGPLLALWGVAAASIVAILFW